MSYLIKKVENLEIQYNRASSNTDYESILERSFLMRTSINKSRCANKDELLFKIKSLIDNSIKSINQMSTTTTTSTTTRRISDDCQIPIVNVQFEDSSNTLSQPINDESLDWKSVQLIEPFKGNFQDFPRFITIFEELVDRTNAKMAKKWLILLKLLDPKSRELLSGNSKDDYTQSLSILKERFSNPFAIREFHIKRIKDLKRTIFESDIDQLRTNISVIKDSYSSLSKDPFNAGFLDYEFTHAVADKIPLSFIRSATILSSNNILNAKELIEFLSNRMIKLEQERFLTKNREPTYHSPQSTVPNQRFSTNTFNNRFRPYPPFHVSNNPSNYVYRNPNYRQTTTNMNGLRSGVPTRSTQNPEPVVSHIEEFNS